MASYSRVSRAADGCCIDVDRLSDGGDGLCPGLEAPVEEVFPLEDAVEPFRHRVLVAVQLLGHARLPAERFQQLPVGVRGVLASPV